MIMITIYLNLYYISPVSSPPPPCAHALRPAPGTHFLSQRRSNRYTPPRSARLSPTHSRPAHPPLPTPLPPLSCLSQHASPKIPPPCKATYTYTCTATPICIPQDISQASRVALEIVIVLLNAVMLAVFVYFITRTSWDKQLDKMGLDRRRVYEMEAGEIQVRNRTSAVAAGRVYAATPICRLRRCVAVTVRWDWRRLVTRRFMCGRPTCRCITAANFQSPMQPPDLCFAASCLAPSRRRCGASTGAAPPRCSRAPSPSRSASAPSRRSSGTPAAPCASSWRSCPSGRSRAAGA